MLIMIGKVMNVVKEKTTGGTELTTVQLMSNVKGKMRIENITDWDNRQWKVDQEIKTPVYATAWKNGNGVSYTAIKAD